MCQKVLPQALQRCWWGAQVRSLERRLPWWAAQPAGQLHSVTCKSKRILRRMLHCTADAALHCASQGLTGRRHRRAYLRPLLWTTRTKGRENSSAGGKCRGWKERLAVQGTSRAFIKRYA